jgi:hypothetical protein
VRLKNGDQSVISDGVKEVGVRVGESAKNLLHRFL